MEEIQKHFKKINKHQFENYIKSIFFQVKTICTTHIFSFCHIVTSSKSPHYYFLNTKDFKAIIAEFIIKFHLAISIDFTIKCCKRSFSVGISINFYIKFSKAGYRFVYKFFKEFF